MHRLFTASVQQLAVRESLLKELPDLQIQDYGPPVAPRNPIDKPFQTVQFCPRHAWGEVRRATPGKSADKTVIAGPILNGSSHSAFY